MDRETIETLPLLEARNKAFPPNRANVRRKRSDRPLFGEMAVAAGLLHEDMLATALDRQKRWGSLLGTVLVSTGAVRAADVARLYGRQRGVPVVDLEREPPDPSLADPTALNFYLREGCLPWRRRAGETVYVAADPDAAREAIAAREGRHLPIFVTSQRDLRRTLTRGFAATLTDRATFDLMRRMPESSAARRLTPAQVRMPAVFSILLLAALPFLASSILTAANIGLGLIFIALATLRYISIFVGLASPPSKEETAYANYGTPPDTELPVYTVMVPLFREARVLPILARALREIDYPGIR